MQVKRSRKPWFTGVVIGLMLPLMATTVTAETTEYPEELSFLAETKLPAYLYVSGEITITDSTGVPMMIMPFRFYWEEGSYALDVRNTGGGIFIFIRGVADTVWIYDFMNKLGWVSLRDQNLGQTTGLPFAPKDILPLFNLYPEGFLSQRDTFYYDDSLLVVKVRDGTTYYFDKETNLLKKLTKARRKITFSEYKTKKRVTLPSRIYFNQGFLAREAVGTQFRVLEVSLKRQKEDNILSSPVPENMPRTFDIRPD